MLSQSSYSLPPTPLTATFEESLPSAKRRKTQRAADGENTASQQSKNTTETPDQNTFSGSHQDSVPTGDSEGSHSSFTPINSKERRKSQPAASQSSLHTFFLKKPQVPERRKSLATESELINRKNQSSKKPKPTKPSAMENSAAQGNRKARKSTPGRLNGAENVEKGGDHSRATSRASTPHSTRSERKPRNVAAKDSAKADKADKAKQRAKSLSATLTYAANKASRGQSNGAAQSAIAEAPTPPVSTPKNSATRSSRQDRKSTGNPQNTLKKETDDTPSQSILTPKPDALAGDSIDSQTPITRSSRPKRNTKQPETDVTTPDVSTNYFETPAASAGMSFDREIADSVDGTPVHIDSDALHFDYDAEMYGNNFGLDGQMDGPASPASTSTAARTSGRTRKPTIRAMESRESEKRFRRTRAASAKAESLAGEDIGGKEGSDQQGEQQPTEPAESGPVSQKAVRPDLATLVKRLYMMAAVAVSPGFVPAPDADTQLEKSRKEFWTQRGVETAGAEGESRLPSKPSLLERSQTSKLWTDKDGWTHTGRINEHGEEFIFVSSDFELYRPNNTYGDAQLPLPPVRFKSHDQAVKDRIFGYPPRIGERNVPRETPFPFMFENVDGERARIKAREDARQRGIPIERSLSVAEIEALIAQHDKAGGSSSTATSDAPAAKDPKATPKTAGGSRKRRRTEPIKKLQDETPTESAPRSSKRRRGTAASNSAAPAVEETPKSPDNKPKTLKLRLTFSNSAAAAAAAATTETPKASSAKGKKRGGDDTEDTTSKPERQVVEDKTPRKRKRSADTPADDVKDDEDTVPSSPATNSVSAVDYAPNTTPGGRPRRRAAAALMAEFHNHAEERARRASARRKATPASEGQDNSTGQPAESVRSV